MSQRPKLLTSRRSTVPRMEAGLPADEAMARLHQAARVVDESQHDLAHSLNEMHRRGIHRKSGHESAVQYAMDVLSMERAEAEELLVTGRLLAELPGCEAAFVSERVSWDQLQLLARITTPETEGEWIERAVRITTDQLERAIAGSSKGDRPRGGARERPPTG